MFRLRIVLWLLSSLIIYTGCSNLNLLNENIQPHINFPEVVKLNYENVEFELMDDNFNLMNWEKEKSILFGEFLGEPINIDLYSNKNESSTSIGLLNFYNQSYLIKSIGYSHDIESLETYIINRYTELEKGLHLIGAIGSSAIGYQYVFYDITNKEWLVYHNWGIPHLIDVDKDGTDELLLQFQGMGNNFPNVTVLSWDSIKGPQITNINDKFIYLIEGIDMSKNRIATTLNSDEVTLEVELIGEEHESRKYKFDTLDTIILVIN